MRQLLASSAIAALAAAADKGEAVKTEDAPEVLDLETAEDNVNERPFTDEEGQRTVTDLVMLDVALRAQGHSLADILAVTAKNVYGVDVR